MAAGADDFGKPRPRAQGIGEALGLDIGAAAALGAHQPAFGERRQRPAHGMAVDPIGFGDLHLARQLFARGKAAVGDAALDAVGDLPPQRHAGGRVLHAHGANIPGTVIRKNNPVVTKQSWRLVIKLSIIIDNLIPARWI